MNRRRTKTGNTNNKIPTKYIDGNTWTTILCKNIYKLRTR